MDAKEDLVERGMVLLFDIKQCSVPITAFPVSNILELLGSGGRMSWYLDVRGEGGYGHD